MDGKNSAKGDVIKFFFYKKMLIDKWRPPLTPTYRKQKTFFIVMAQNPQTRHAFRGHTF